MFLRARTCGRPPLSWRAAYAAPAGRRGAPPRDDARGIAAAHAGARPAARAADGNHETNAANARRRRACVAPRGATLGGALCQTGARAGGFAAGHGRPATRLAASRDFADPAGSRRSRRTRAPRTLSRTRTRAARAGVAPSPFRPAARLCLLGADQAHAPRAHSDPRAIRHAALERAPVGPPRRRARACFASSSHKVHTPASAGGRAARRWRSGERLQDAALSGFLENAARRDGSLNVPLLAQLAGETEHRLRGHARGGLGGLGGLRDLGSAATTLFGGFGKMFDKGVQKVFGDEGGGGGEASGSGVVGRLISHSRAHSGASAEDRAPRDAAPRTPAAMPAAAGGASRRPRARAAPSRATALAPRTATPSPSRARPRVGAPARCGGSSPACSGRWARRSPCPSPRTRPSSARRTPCTTTRSWAAGSSRARRARRRRGRRRRRRPRSGRPRYRRGRARRGRRIPPRPRGVWGLGRPRGQPRRRRRSACARRRAGRSTWTRTRSARPPRRRARRRRRRGTHPVW